MNKRVIFLGADHAGFALKEQIEAWLIAQGHEVTDCGAFALNAADDYPDFGAAVGSAISKYPKTLGVLVCGSSQGICITANKFKGVRAVSVATPADAKLTRAHNNANVVCLSGWKLKPRATKKIITVFLSTPFEGGRHLRRIKKIAKIERKNFK